MDTFRNKLTANSQLKLELIEPSISQNKIKLNIAVLNLYEKIRTAFSHDIKLESISPVNINKLRRKFIEFNQTINSVTKSKFESDLESLTSINSVKLKIGSGTITINFLSKPNQIKTVAALIHAINTFGHTFEYDYDGLQIDIVLDLNYRDLIDRPINANSFDKLRKQSAAFNVSGVTYKHKKFIQLTKSEEIVKLMFHEMIHYVGLDAEFVGLTEKFNWAVSDQNFNLSEAYTEFLSIIINSAYQSVHLSIDFELLLNLEITYSIYLVSNILKFYDYDEDWPNFFQGIGKSKYSPILTWEYVIVRTQLLLNLNQVADLVIPGWKITPNNLKGIVNLMKIDNNFMNELSFFMSNTKPINNISYTAIEIDWDLV